MHLVAGGSGGLVHGPMLFHQQGTAGAAGLYFNGLSCSVIQGMHSSSFELLQVVHSPVGVTTGWQERLRCWMALWCKYCFRMYEYAAIDCLLGKRGS